MIIAFGKHPEKPLPQSVVKFFIKEGFEMPFLFYANFFSCMVQISSALSRNKLISVPYLKFLVRMVQIFSDLNWNKLVSVPYTKFLTPMVQPCHITYENSILWGSNLLV